MTFVSPIKIPLGNPFEASGLCVRSVRGGTEAGRGRARSAQGGGQISRGCRTLFPYYRAKGQSRALAHDNSAGLIRIIDKNVIGPRDNHFGVELTHRVVEELLQLLVGVVDAELLEAVDVEDLEAGDVEDADEGGALALGAVEGAVDADDDPLEEPLVHRLRYRLHRELNLFLQ